MVHFSIRDNRAVAIVFKPQPEWPKMFGFHWLYKEPLPRRSMPNSDGLFENPVGVRKQ